ncbi:PTS system, N-acetylglucosamine-specific IIA component PTS system, N-acetylglucosamine-specific IIB component PTS system, N-acetylglucosamine-specific IIC component [Spiroplasma clarkii]|uniref:PTS transporter subunit EIIC n=1 Tax=Spiroplasma clarkii TaxID=2139 RepID=UPI000B562745|nr:PTS transporter subunit EIIC [Spiroplasma clarkii]ARU91006.1 PTS system, N-acetylglucosamine-specific IIA component PTS system, N-acetylglucosamine-specific IIB component PTS system, N-acetylglucosamine-specific IIC component [Spiroplasma clarkii]
MKKEKIKSTQITPWTRFKGWLSKARGSMESFGRAILVPVTVIPLLALIGSVGYAMQAIAVEAGTYEGTVKIIADAIKNIGMIAITNIDFLVAVGLAAGLAKQEKIAAALSGLMAYAALHFAANLMIQSIHPDMLSGTGPKENGLAIRFGVMSFQYNAFGGMIAGLIGYIVHKYTYRLKFPKYLAFFGGPRFSPVASTLIAWLVGMPLGISWIYISRGLVAFGKGIGSLGPASPFLYGVTNRALIPFGLHQVTNYFLYYTSVGTTWVDSTGRTIEGIYSVAIAKLGEGVFLTAKDTWIINGTFPTNMFSLLGAALALYFVIPKENRKVAGSAIISAMMASFLAGTTEPIEFTFLFTAPWLYGIHVLFTGITYLLMYVCNFAQVSTRGSGLITWIAVNAVNFRNIQNVWGLFIIGPIMGSIYFVTFYFLIKYFNWNTPGRDGQIAVIGKDLKDKQADE